MTYCYSTGKITREWHLMKHDDICRLRDVPSRIGAYGCSHCPYNKGNEVNWESQSLDEMFFTKCTHPKSIDAEGSYEIISQILEKFEIEALSAL